MSRSQDGEEAAPRPSAKAWLDAAAAEPESESLRETGKLTGDLDVFEPMPWPTSEFQVQISGLPNKILSAPMMEAVLQQAGLDAGVLDMKMHVGKPCGKVVVTFSSLEVVERCIRHFYGCQWDASGTAVGVEVLSAICEDLNQSAAGFSADAPVFEMPPLQEEASHDWTSTKALSENAPIFVPKSATKVPMFVPHSEGLPAAATAFSADAPVFLPGAGAAENKGKGTGEGTVWSRETGAQSAVAVISSDTSTEVGDSEAEDEQAGLHKSSFDEQEAAMVGVMA
jgi:hypothetical protein